MTTPGASGQLVGMIDTPRTYQFRDDFNQTILTRRPVALAYMAA